MPPISGHVHPDHGICQPYCTFLCRYVLVIILEVSIRTSAPSIKS